MPSGRTGRLLALGLLIAALAVLYAGVVVPALGFYRDREASLATDELIEPRLRAAAEELPYLEARIAELRQKTSAAPITLDGASDALAAAALQSRVEALAADAKVTIISTDGVPAEARGEYRKIGLRMSLTGSYDDIVRLLGAIDTAQPPLVIDNLQLHGNALLTGTATPPQLNAQFVVYGLRGSETTSVAKQ